MSAIVNTLLNHPRMFDYQTTYLNLPYENLVLSSQKIYTCVCKTIQQIVDYTIQIGKSCVTSSTLKIHIIFRMIDPWIPESVKKLTEVCCLYANSFFIEFKSSLLVNELRTKLNDLEKQKQSTIIQLQKADDLIAYYTRSAKRQEQHKILDQERIVTLTRLNTLLTEENGALKTLRQTTFKNSELMQIQLDGLQSELERVKAQCSLRENRAQQSEEQASNLPSLSSFLSNQEISLLESGPKGDEC